jgi:putative phosphonate metabolism protein
MSYARYALYYVPPEGPLAEFGAAWLGWNIIDGQETRQFDLPALHDITMTPRKYGFHGTLKPPFRTVETATFDDLDKAAADMASSVAPAICEGLELTALGHFLALTPRGDVGSLRKVAEACVRGLDSYRAPASEAELERRRKAGLSARQDALLQKWGYPYVFEEFRFHLTLSGRLPKEEMTEWSDILRQSLPELPAPFLVDQIALCGEREDGRFELIQRYALTG